MEEGTCQSPSQETSAAQIACWPSRGAAYDVEPAVQEEVSFSLLLALWTLINFLLVDCVDYNLIK